MASEEAANRGANRDEYNAFFMLSLIRSIRFFASRFYGLVVLRLI